MFDRDEPGMTSLIVMDVWTWEIPLLRVFARGIRYLDKP